MTTTHTTPPQSSTTAAMVPTPPSGCPDTTVLTAMLADAARRAEGLLRGTSRHEQDPILDLVRLIQQEHATPETATTAAEQLGLSGAALGRLRRAYTFGGLDGVHTAHHSHTPEPSLMQAARTSLQQHCGLTENTITLDLNRLTVDGSDVQVRLSRQGQWFPYTRAHEIWSPARGHSPDPVQAYRAALTARRNRNG
ncbi:MULTISPECIES: hypothetical protein [unclassified Crossiella]|uniref:hypothetical protein n=1 Tax=unclassified Crossiella TaxID=2620835 RepID=UPI001FFE45C6|nr:MULTISPECIES: hypothetical protein [unclassified Crossiella]MCK2245453.1 hypothetical protein [Crossiella sp. S99.2]MCK2259105.1 hypothetical protein [Crossiella sp. S99.1]